MVPHLHVIGTKTVHHLLEGQTENGIKRFPYLHEGQALIGAKNFSSFE
jgi:hypothetical protein